MDLAPLNQLITDARRYGRAGGQILIAAESDRGRILNSAAVRRLQQKTQVFPLERNAAVRSRLTHSLEVMQNGRFIVRELDRRLSGEKNYDATIFRAIESIVEMACLMHDIGNPPFGHFGEAAISEWFAANVTDLFAGQISKNPNVNIDDLKRELCNFEGNAQAIRLVHSLMTLNLTYTQIAAILKYTRQATEKKPEKGSYLSYLRKKPGYYWSEKALIAELYKQLNLTAGNRHPLSYIMEAADDIAYGLADIEDAVEKGVLSYDEVIKGIQDEYENEGGMYDQRSLEKAFSNEKTSLAEVLSTAKEKYERNSNDKINQFFISLRVSIHGILVNHAVNRFIQHFEEVVSGSFNAALLEDESDAHKLSNALQNLAVKKVFSHPEVERQELRGHTIISRLLDAYSPLLNLSYDEFWALANKDDAAFSREVREVQKSKPLCSRLFNNLSNKHLKAYKKAVVEWHHDQPVERYFRCRLLQDYISGMTDQFAFDEYRSLLVIE